MNELIQKNTNLNSPPNAPNKPSRPSSGEKNVYYEYSTITNRKQKSPTSNFDKYRHSQLDFFNVYVKLDNMLSNDDL